MCITCGCSPSKHSASKKKVVDVFEKVLSNNDSLAARNRLILDQHNILCFNLMSSPGSGKTSLLEVTIEQLKDQYRIAVIEGDLETENDAKRIRDKGVPAIQIVTGSACHLEADMVFSALQKLDLPAIDLLFIENVGNLVCPASFDLGHHQNITLLSTTEGDDKPAKYPVMFRAADICVFTKTDLLDYLDDFDVHQAEINLRQLANTAPCIPLSTRQPQSMKAWFDLLVQTKLQHQQKLKQQKTFLPKMQKEGKTLHKETHYEPTSTVLA